MTRAEAISKLQSHVKLAHRRLTLQRFVVILAWSLFATLLAATLAVAVPKIWAIDLNLVVWIWSWIGAAAAGSLLLAVAWTLLSRRNLLQAAIEIDDRFELKERVSSSLALTDVEIEGEAGQALLYDAVRRVERIDIGSGFPVRVDWCALLPLAPALIIALVVVLIPNAQQKKEAQAAHAKVLVRKQIRKSTDKLKKRALQKKKKAEALGLKETQGAFDKLTKGLDKLQDLNDGSRRQAMHQLSDLSTELQKRRDMLGGADQMKKHFSQLKNLKPGPASKLAKSMKNGDYQKAPEALEQLKQQLMEGEMSAEEKQKMAEQLQQMADKMQQMANAHKQAKQQFQQKIDQAKQRGDMEEVNKLQQVLDKLNQQSQQMATMQQMSQKLDQCSQCMSQGQNQGQSDMQDAMAQLDQIAQTLRQLQRANSEMEMLDEALDQISMAKKSMNCKQCNGSGCAVCMGEIPGFGMGPGQGDRPEEKTNTGFYNSKVKSNTARGKAVIVGEVRGPNVSGETRVEIHQEIEAFHSGEGDPLTGKRLPKAQRDHVLEYMNSVRNPAE